MAKKVGWVFMVLLAILIGLYPLIYFFIDRNFGLLSSKSDELLGNTLWNATFYTHIGLGGLALLIGWIQFNARIRNKHLNLHRNIGKIYITAALLSSIAGFYIAFFATGGFVNSLGFICLAIAWFYTTLKGYLYIRNKQVREHQKMMIYSYAVCFAAVTLRIWLPLLTALFGDFTPAYAIVAWLAWVPNLAVAHLIVKKVLPQKIPAGAGQPD
jgi:uncharacterized membrane protein